MKESIQYFIIICLVLIPSSCTTRRSQKVVSPTPEKTSKKEIQLQELVLRRAIFDFNCEQENLKIYKLGNLTYGVFGCQRKSTYIVSCPYKPGFFGPVKDKCTAILNNGN